MKRFISILLIIIVVLSLCACNKNDGANQSQNNTQNTEPTVNEPTGDVNNDEDSTDSGNETTPDTGNNEPWLTKEISWPSFPKITYVEKNIGSSDVKHAVMEDAFKFDFESAYQSISNNEFIKQNYIIGNEHSERMGDAATYNDVGCLATYSVYDSIVGYYKDTYKAGEWNTADFKITFGKDTSIIESGYDYVNLYMGNVVVERTEFTPENVKCFDNIQNEILNILEKIVGAEYANYMVYAKNEDDTGYNHKMFKRCDSNGPEEGYCVSREIKGTEISITLYAQIDPFKNSNKTFNGDHVSMYQNFKYKINDIFVDARVGDLDPLQFNDFAKDYMQSSTKEYVKTMPPAHSMYMSELVVGNTKKYSFSSRWEARLTSRVTNSPMFQLNYTIYETDGEISDISVSLLGSPYSAKDGDMDEIVRNAKTMLAMWLPEGFDLSHIVDASNNNPAKIDWVLFDKECTICTSAYASNTVRKGNYGNLSIDIDMKK